jgi:hypothetical protein
LPNFMSKDCSWLLNSDGAWKIHSWSCQTNSSYAREDWLNQSTTC